MLFSTRFVSATLEKTSTERNVPAPYLRRDFVLSRLPQKAEITVCGLGFYKIFINGKHITKSFLAPYIVNPDQLIPYDTYDITELLTYGENVIAFMLGNGMQNGFDGFVWSFEKANFISAPKLAFALEMTLDGDKKVIEADEKVMCHPSPIYFDGLRMGEKYDARREIPNWNKPGCDVSDWTPAIPVNADAGECMFTEIRPIVKVRDIAPISITKEDDAYVYDFGENCAGLTRLRINGSYGQHIVIDHGELIKNGKFTQENIIFSSAAESGHPAYIQRTEYICHGGDLEEYIPSFTYYGFRYAKVSGITEEQATPELLTYEVMNTELGNRGDFRCSDEILNTLQEMTRRATCANFFHFPTDCPHREKNGWTADAALSAEQALMNFEPEDNYYMWEKCICRAMDNRGALPGIVPTGGWGFHWGNGPAWDSVLIYLPYFTAVLRDDLRCAKEASGAMLRYFHYLSTRMDQNGLLEIGLGDWCPAIKDYNAPLIFTDSVISYDLAVKAAYLYGRLGEDAEADYCRAFAEKIRRNIREHLLEDKVEMRFKGAHQSVQAMAIFYGLCDSDEEKARALETLVRYIHDKDDHIGTGVLGGRVIFRVLCDNGYEDLAIKMITRSDEPSYGCMIRDGLTALGEQLSPPYCSLNHHFWGDISALMIEYFAGIRINPALKGAKTAQIAPVFPKEMSFVEGYHHSLCGRIRSEWKRLDNGEILLSLEIPEGLECELVAPLGYSVRGKKRLNAATGDYLISLN
ncbi:MAG: family 78 glycoside hydrolase catalytic domain [Clostridia bacterium]|nr:family 78 glycoside hydrolase catalytic domain [Clostridia bacterium]